MYTFTLLLSSLTAVFCGGASIFFSLFSTLFTLYFFSDSPILFSVNWTNSGWFLGVIFGSIFLDIIFGSFVVCAYVCKYIDVCVYIYMYIYIYIHVNIYIFTHMYIYSCIMYIHIYLPQKFSLFWVGQMFRCFWQMDYELLSKRLWYIWVRFSIIIWYI
jgi:hypothetical protein